ncbi:MULTISPECIES: DinB family protein [Sphingobacterium]|uniref:DinB family protein n=1 Tax=Sphingobacterium tenebrionis TaxID=3111775 RepID=A0ABU8I6L4_9SPHI|nr:DinB family protein [Sphingobacterium sp. CZ-2]QBR11390.1 DUF1572 domain-containing protein [Sphingobacterium sp. CZ-2]
MEKCEFMASRFREVYLSGTWIANTNYQDQLQQINWQIASTQIADLNTIAAIVYHINYYLQGILEGLEDGQFTIQDKFSFDVPEIVEDREWQILVHVFLDNAEKFAQTIERFDESKLEETFFEERFGNYWRNIEGVIEHGYYHLGQIVLIRKLIAADH